LIFVDTTIWASGIDTSDTLHKDGAAVMDALASGTLGPAMTTDFILDETLTLLKTRGGNTKAVAEAIENITSSSAVTLLYVDEALFRLALQTYQKYESLSFADAVTLSVMHQHRIRDIFSHDNDFDIKGILRKERP